eukprot:GFYU01003583.1.p1 GENE.GFYU01003583.1~~GFYU01003583.1.p1  ORF type:complete len:316 (+),score=76.74 GFYU01003583.1:148-1095(+)
MTTLMKDRTQEFFTLAEGLRSSGTQATRPVGRRTQRSEFAVISSDVGRNIHNTHSKLQKLQKLAQKKSIFDDPAAEIQELTVIIKQDITNLNQQIDHLQHIAHSSSLGNNRQREQCSDHIVGSLKTKLMDVTKMFQEVLQMRTENMKQLQDRRHQFSSDSGLKKRQGASRQTGENPLYQRRQQKAKAAAASSSDQPNSAAYSTSFMDMEGGGQQQQSLIPKQDSYLASRAEAVESIQSTIVELGGIFQQLASLVAEQQHLADRVDTNLDDTMANVDNAEDQLRKYWRNMSGDTWLIIRVFFVLIVFILFFVFFVA